MALRKTLGRTDSPCIMALRRLLESQSKQTIVTWCLDYAEAHMLPIYEGRRPGDDRPRQALAAARAWLAGAVKLPEAKRHILAAHAAAREAEGDPAAQAAARACGQAASTVHAPGHSLGLAFYGGAAAATPGWAPAKARRCTKPRPPRSAPKCWPPCGPWRWKTSPSRPKYTGGFESGGPSPKTVAVHRRCTRKHRPAGDAALGVPQGAGPGKFWAGVGAGPYGRHIHRSNARGHAL